LDIAIAEITKKTEISIGIESLVRAIKTTAGLRRVSKGIIRL
jgi:hypothetical protein